MDEFDESPAASRPKPSQTPSWIMLGFILGALCVWALPGSRPPQVTSTPTPAVETKPASVATKPRLTDVEAVFEMWKGHALWADDTTYVCMWDVVSGTRTFRDCFEVIRKGDAHYFRSIPRPRDLRTLGGIPEESPLEFLHPVPEPRGMFGQRLSPPDGYPGGK